MPESSVTFLSLARQSTGETRFFTALLRSSPAIRPTLLAGVGTASLFGDFPGVVVGIDFPEKFDPDHALELVSAHADRRRTLVLLDLNACILENAWESARTEVFLLSLEELGFPAVFLYDVMGILATRPERVEALRRAATSRIEGFVRRAFACGAPVSVKKGHYLSRFLRPRSLNQIVQAPSSFRILRSIPYCWPDPDDQDDIRYFHCRFESVERREPRGDTVLLGLSAMATNFASPQAVREYFRHVSTALSRELGATRQHVIDPTGCLEAMEPIPGVDFEIHGRMPRERFLSTLATCRFATFFIPTASVGVTAIQNGIPFVSIHSSMDTAVYVDHETKAQSLMAFTSLGIWEDLAYLPGLVRPENPYFQAVQWLDSAAPDGFARVEAALSSGEAAQAIESFRMRMERTEYPSLQEVLLA